MPGPALPEALQGPDRHQDAAVNGAEIASVTGSIEALVRSECWTSNLTSARGDKTMSITVDVVPEFVAEVETGILRVDLASLQAAPLERPARLSLLGIDGLYARNRELVAVQNWHFACQVVRYRLNATGTRIERVDVLERRDPRFALPTTGALVDDWFYFMANTQVDRFESGVIASGPPLAPIRMLRTKL